MERQSGDGGLDYRSAWGNFHTLIRLFCSEIKLMWEIKCLAATSSFTLNYFYSSQAQLEAEIENLSWKVERAETTDRGDLENQMDVAEKRRTTLLKDFFPTEA